MVDFSTYNTQILCLAGTIISKAHYNGKYNYVRYRIAKDSVLKFTVIK